MRLHNLTYLSRTGLRNLFANKLMSLACIGSLTACFLLVGAAVWFAYALTGVLDRVGGEHELTVYLEEGLSGADIEALGRTLGETDNVRAAAFHSREENLAAMCDKLGETPESLLANPESDNPFLATYVVYLRDTGRYRETLDVMLSLRGVAAVRGSADTAQALGGLRQAGLTACGGIILILAAVSVMIVTNTIKMTLFTRRKEIGIMKYVGATDAFIRIPYVVEGVLIGLLAALAALGLLFVGYTQIAAHLPDWTDRLEWRMLLENAAITWRFWLALLVGFAAAGSAVGFVGGGLFVRKYLKV